MLVTENTSDIIYKYITIVNNYSITFHTNITGYKHHKYLENLYIRGLNLITNIFSISLLYLDNILDINNLCEKGYIYFIEFVNQINSTNFTETNFELTLKDAIIFSYKKTLFTIENTIEIHTNSYEKQKTHIINIFIKIINNVYMILNNKLYIQDSNKNKNQIIDKITFDINKLSKKIINNLDLHSIHHDTNININNINNINNIVLCIDKIYNILNLLINNLNHYKTTNSDSINIDIIFNNLLTFIDKIINKELYLKNINNDLITDKYLLNNFNNEALNINQLITNIFK